MRNRQQNGKQAESNYLKTSDLYWWEYWIKVHPAPSAILEVLLNTVGKSLEKDLIPGDCCSY